MGKARTHLLLGTLCILILVTSAPAFGADPSLVGWWKLDDGSGTKAVDSSGTGNDGTVTGGPTWVTGQLKGALQFNGTSQYIECGNAASLNVTAQVTLAAWIYPTAAGNGQHQHFVTKGDMCYALKHNTGNFMEFNIYEGAWYTASGPAVTAATFNNTWHHVAGTFDGSSLKIYVDGVLQPTVGTHVGGIANTATSVSIARDNDGGGRRYFTGMIDDARIYNRALTDAEIAVVMQGTAVETASGPNPADKATDVARDAVLSWKPGVAGTHNVYFGTSLDDVNAASTSSALCVGQGQDANSYDPPGRLDFGTTYYWRVDEVNGTADHTVFPGEIWSFTTEPLAYPITAKIAAKASSQKSVNEGPEKTVNASGIANDLADVNNKAMWLTLSTKNGGTFPAWIQYDFDKLYKLQEMWVWNYNGTSELDMNVGAKTTKIEYLSEADQWTTLGDFEFAQGIAEDGYAHNTTVPFNGVAAKAVRLTINETWGSKTQTGLSEVRFYYVPVWAKEPKPASDSNDIDPTTLTLSWRSGREASSHDVYVGTDANALPKQGTVPTNSFTPAGLELGTQYYWRVDEVNQTTNPTTWTGDVWVFRTPAFLVVDGMESYNATDKAIFDTWADGYGTMTNGGQVGYGQPANNTFCETVTTHGGTKSMPFLYGRDGITTSEATRTYATAQNWKAAGIKTLTLWFYGAAENSAVALYVKINDTKIAYSGAAANLQQRRWNPWNIDLTTVAAAGAVAKLTIGVTGSGSGTLLVDDLRLYKEAPAVLPPVDPGTNGLVSYFNMEGGKVADSLSGVTGTLNATTFVDSATTALGKALMCTGGTTAETTQFVDLGATYWDKVVSKLSSCTFSAWVNYTATGTTWQRVFDFGSGTNNYVFLSTGSATQGFPRFAVKTSVANAGSTGTGAVETGVTSPYVLWTGWHHLAGVVDTAGSAGYPVASLYVDGVRVAGPNASRLPKDIALTTAWQNWLGKSQWPDPYLNGAIDELRVFNRALTAGEISYLAGDR